MDSLLTCIAIGITIGFTFINSFHDGGNVIATIVSSRSMRPLRALLLASVAEFVGPLLLGTAIARTMADGILKTDLLVNAGSSNVLAMIIAAVGGAIFWNRITW